MFTTPCFIKKNTPELRWYLQGLGYEYIGKSGKSASHRDDSFIVAESGKFYETIWIAEEHKPKLIDCGLNEELFKAIAALRDDSDYWQWFTDGDTFELCHGIDFLKEDYTTMELNEKTNFYHKATVEKLIEHFKQV